MDEQQEEPRRKGGRRPGVKNPPQNKEERDQRNFLIFQRFIAGHSEREIGRSMGLTGARIHQIIEAELKEGGRHRELLTDEALAMYTTRLETLLKAVWPKVLQQDLKAVDVARRLMEQQARLYGLLEEKAKPTQPDQELLEDEESLASVDDLTRFRMQRARKPDAESGAV